MSLKKVATVFALSLFVTTSLLGPTGALASNDGKIVAKVDISTQMMEVYVDGTLEYSWRVSTGQDGFATPTGQYKPQYMHPMHYSREYELTPMPYAIFFREGGFAIHGTGDTGRLGKKASKGCVRLDARNAKELFKLVKIHGEKNTAIIIEE